jgi:hypothetical protein
MLTFLQKLALVWANNANIFAENIFKIITSVPGEVIFHFSQREKKWFFSRTKRSLSKMWKKRFVFRNKKNHLLETSVDNVNRRSNKKNHRRDFVLISNRATGWCPKCISPDFVKIKLFL